MNGQRAGTAAATLPLSVVDDRNVWIGRSQWPGDPLFNGELDEFRIYDGPFLDSDIAAHYAAGPNTIAAPPVQLSISVSGSNLVIRWSSSAAPGATLQSSPALGGGASWSGAGLPAPTIVDGQNQVTVPIPATTTFYRLVN